MAYSATYTTSDLPNMVVDLIGNGVVQVIAFIGLIVLIAVVTLLVKQGKTVVKSV